MARKKTREQITTRLNIILLDRLDRYGQRVGRTRADLIDRAVEEYLDRHAPDIQPKPSRK